MITEITTAALDRIKTTLSGIVRTATQKEVQGIFVNPAVVGAIVDAKCRKITSETYKVEAVLSVLVTFKSMKGETERRQGVMPFVEGIMALLLLQNLGLAITPLVPEGFSEITTDEDYTNGVIKYVLRFWTGFNLVRQNDEVVTDLLAIGLSYLLEPGDAISDAADEVTLEQ